MAGKVPELAGASEAPVDLSGSMTTTGVQIDQSVALVTGEEAPGASARRVYLHLEGIKGVGMPGSYRVLLDLPDDSLPPAVVGTLSPFGLEQASDPDGPHGGNGLSVSYEITRLVFTLGLAQGDVDRLQIRFQRMFDDSQAFGQAPGLEGITPSDQEANIEIGQHKSVFRISAHGFGNRHTSSSPACKIRSRSAPDTWCGCACLALAYPRAPAFLPLARDGFGDDASDAYSTNRPCTCSQFR